MSLINEALKKAQRQRTEESAVTPPMPGGGPVARRGAPRSSQSTLLIAVGAVALVVVSVVLTIFLLNRPSAPPAVAVAAPKEAPRAQPAQPAEPPAPSPVVVAPVTAAPAPAKAVTPEPAAPAKAEPTTPTPAASTPAPSVASTPAPATRAPKKVEPPAGPPPPNPAAKQDERAHAFIDALRVTGIRSSGNDSRVLMNERVYRVNDIVERTLNLRLVKVGTDSLTFVDQNGAVYVKYF